MIQNQPGFHLIEIIIALAIISLLAGLSLPLYSQHLIHEKRLEAESMLSKLAIAMEKYHIEQNTYQGATLADLSFPEFILKNNYQLSIQTTANDYQLMAKPLGTQAEKDEICGALILKSTGEKETTGTGKSDDCW